MPPKSGRNSRTGFGKRWSKESGKKIDFGSNFPTGGFPAFADLHASKPGLKVKRERLRMDAKKKIRLSLAEWKKYLPVWNSLRVI